MNLRGILFIREIHLDDNLPNRREDFREKNSLIALTISKIL